LAARTPRSGIDHASAFTTRVPAGFAALASEIGALTIRLFSDSAFAPLDGTHFRFGSNSFNHAITEVVTSPESIRGVLPGSGFGPLSTDVFHFDGAAGCPGDWDGGSGNQQRRCVGVFSFTGNRGIETITNAGDTQTTTG